jgi:hypothetical protein
MAAISSGRKKPGGILIPLLVAELFGWKLEPDDLWCRNGRIRVG